MGQIRIDPFNESNLSPNSYDFTLGDTLRIYDELELDAAKENSSHTVGIGPDGYLLRPDRIYLGSTVEVIGSGTYVPIIRGRSSTARLGLFVHVTADLIDLGSFGQLTLQLRAVVPLRVYAGWTIGQVTFWRTLGERTMYAGKYQGSVGPQASKSHMDPMFRRLT